MLGLVQDFLCPGSQHKFPECINTMGRSEAERVTGVLQGKRFGVQVCMEVEVDEGFAAANPFGSLVVV